MTGFGEWAEGLDRDREQPHGRQGRPPRWDVVTLSGQLYDLLANATVACEHDVLGYEAAEACERLHVPKHIFHKIVREQRLIFGGDDEIGLPIHRCGNRHIYHLSGRIEGGQGWMGRRLKGLIAQQEVNVAWWRSMVKAYAHDEVRRTYAESILRSSSRLLEDMQLMLAAN